MDIGVPGARLLCGDCIDVLKTFDNESVNCVVTSPPYWSLRDYGVDGQLGMEQTPEEYVDRLVYVFREVRRVMRDDGTLWLNLGDSYNPGNSTNSSGGPSKKQKSNTGAFFRPHPVSTGLKPKDLVGIPWRVAFALQTDGWYLRSDIIWAKQNCMPESVSDRPTRSHEYIFLLSKSEKYYYDSDAVREPVAQSSIERAAYGWHCERPSTKSSTDNGIGIHTEMMGERFANPMGRNKRDVWSLPTEPYHGAHFAVFPKKLIEPCILAGCPAGGTVLDPFMGSGTTGVVALNNNRNFIGIDLNPEYVELAKKRITEEASQLRIPT